MSDSLSKPGKVLRVDLATWQYVTKLRRPKEKLTTLIRRLIGIPARRGEYEVKKYFILPESKVVCESPEEARGEAIINAVRKGKKKPTEQPLEVREIEK